MPCIPRWTPRYIVEEKHAHYLLNLQATAAHFAT